MSPVAVGAPRRLVEIELNGTLVRVPEGSTLLDACKVVGIDVPTLCYGPTLTPRNACRVCMVELDGSRVLVPSCSRKAEEGMVVRTDTDRTHHARKMVLEFLGSTADLSVSEHGVEWTERYGAEPGRYGERESVPAKVDNELYVRVYDKCILCYKCVDACGEQWQNSFAITIAGRGAKAHVSTEFDAPLTDSACVYCGNCIAVCPTGALAFSTEYNMRAEGTWEPERHTETTTVCPFCGVGCNLTLHVQDNQIVKVTSPDDHSVTHGNLCIKGRFGWAHVQPKADKT
jgi:predicted molibdopterin-dependent oxidoreductase YjgC